MIPVQLKHCGPFSVHPFAFSLFVLVCTAPCRAQTVETVGSRALGMGGAFVAVANDATASWWNPAGLGSGPFLDMSLAIAATESRADAAAPDEVTAPAQRSTAKWLALGTPPFGFSYYRLRLTDLAPVSGPSDSIRGPTVTESGSREHTRAGVPLRSVAASQIGITLVQTLVPGVHAGATVKYLRGTVRTAEGDDALGTGALLDAGDALDGGDGDGAFGIDVGVIGVGGPLRAGVLVRNAVESELENAAGVARFERHVRAGVAYDAEAGGGPPLMVALDADLSTAVTARGERRNVAVGAEQWLWNERLGVRGGARFNTTGAKERAATAGVSVAVRAGLFLDAHAVRGGREDDRGWGVAARVAF